jgi:group I intron endonuclease
MKNSGIYIIKNVINGKFYLGSSINLSKRKRTHFRDLKNNKHHCIYLQRAYNKYGKENFEFIILFNCSKEYCLEFEEYFIKSLSPKYNTSKVANCPMGGRKHSLDTIEKFKNRSVKSGKEHYLYGKSPESSIIEKMRKARIGTKQTVETKTKMSETAKRINSISRIDRTKQRKKLIDNDGIIYDSLVDAANINNISVATICDILKGRHSKTRKGKVFKYYE